MPTQNGSGARKRPISAVVSAVDRVMARRKLPGIPADPTTPRIIPGKSGELRIEPKAGFLPHLCPLPAPFSMRKALTADGLGPARGEHRRHEAPVHAALLRL